MITGFSACQSCPLRLRNKDFLRCDPVPDYWDIGEVFQRLVEDTSDEEHVVEGIRKVFSSWIAERILNFNSDLFYQPREYIAECYRAGVIIPA